MPKDDRDEQDVPYEPGQTRFSFTPKLEPWEKLEDVHVSFPVSFPFVVSGGESSSIGAISAAQVIQDGKSLVFDRVASGSWPAQQTVRITGRVTQMPLGEYMKRLADDEDE